MYNITIIWAVLCSIIILAYPLILCRRPISVPKINKVHEVLSFQDNIELYSFEIKNECPGWSFIIDTPPLTGEVVSECPTYFYIELADGHRKLPYKDLQSGFEVSVHKSDKKMYLTCKSLTDYVSNYYLSANFLKSIKVLVVKTNSEKVYSKWDCKYKGTILNKKLETAGIDVENYEDVLSHFCEVSYFEYKGHFRKQHSA